MSLQYQKDLRDCYWFQANRANSQIGPQKNQFHMHISECICEHAHLLPIQVFLQCDNKQNEIAFFSPHDSSSCQPTSKLISSILLFRASFLTGRYMHNTGAFNNSIVSIHIQIFHMSIQMLAKTKLSCVVTHKKFESE